MKFRIKISQYLMKPHITYDQWLYDRKKMKCSSGKEIIDIKVANNGKLLLFRRFVFFLLFFYLSFDKYPSYSAAFFHRNVSSGTERYVELIERQWYFQSYELKFLFSVAFISLI